MNNKSTHDTMGLSSSLRNSNTFKLLSISRFIGITLLILLAICAFFGPELIGKDPASQSLLNTLQSPN